MTRTARPLALPRRLRGFDGFCEAPRRPPEYTWGRFTLRCARCFVPGARTRFSRRYRRDVAAYPAHHAMRVWETRSWLCCRPVTWAEAKTGEPVDVDPAVTAQEWAEACIRAGIGSAPSLVAEARIAAGGAELARRVRQLAGDWRSLSAYARGRAEAWELARVPSAANVMHTIADIREDCARQLEALLRP